MDEGSVDLCAIHAQGDHRYSPELHQRCEDDQLPLQDCVKIAADYLQCTPNALPRGGGINGLNVSELISGGFRLSNRWSMGAFVVHTFKKLFEACALEYLRRDHCELSLLVETWPTRSLQPKLSKTALQHLTLGLCHVRDSHNMSYSLVEISSLGLDVGASFSPSLRLFAPLYNTMILFNAMSKEKGTDYAPLPFDFGQSGSLEHLSAKVNEERKYKQDIEQTSFEEYLNASGVFVVTRRSGAPPVVEEGMARLTTIAIRTKERLGLCIFHLTSAFGRLFALNTQLTFDVGGATHDFDLDVRASRMNGASQFVLCWDTKKATWYQSREPDWNCVASVVIVRQPTRFRVNGSSAACKYEDCRNVRCGYIHDKADVMVGYLRGWKPERVQRQTEAPGLWTDSDSDSDRDDDLGASDVGSDESETKRTALPHHRRRHCGGKHQQDDEISEEVATKGGKCEVHKKRVKRHDMK